MSTLIRDLKEESDTPIGNVREKVDEYLTKTFPAFRLRTSIITSLVFIELLFFTNLLDSYGLVEGITMVDKEAVFQFLLFFVVFNVLIPLVVLNIFIQIYLKPVQKQYRGYFETKTIEDDDAYKNATNRLEKLNLYLGIIIGAFYLLGTPWRIHLSEASVSSAIFYILSRISILGVAVTFNIICIKLFVRRRLLFVLDVYELKVKIRFSQRQIFVNTIIPLLLLLNAMFVFTDVTLKINDSGTNRMEAVQNRATSLLGGKRGGAPAPTSSEVDISKILDDKHLAKGFGLLIFFLLVQSSLLYIFLGILQSRQMKDMHAKMADLSDGSGDLTKRIRILEIDDLAIVISYLNTFIENLRRKLLVVEDASSHVSRSSNTLSEELQNTSAATEEMVASVEQINRTTGSRAAVIEETGKTLISMIDSLEQVKNSVDTQATFVEQTSSAINEMAASIQSVTQATGKANNLSTHLSQAASEGGKAVNDSIAAVKDVETSSEEVNNLVSAITKISGQTNMLAMNAAIEAAHAGDAGRGFAVVAEEVRNLAESSSRSAKLITEQIQQMVGVVNNGVQMSENAGGALQKVLDDITQTTDLINGIALSMDEQNAGATEILNSISALVDATHVIKKVTQDEMNKNTQIRHSVDQVVQAFEEIRLATEEQAKGTHDMIRIVSQLQSVVQENQDVVQTLSEEFSGFKLK